MVAEDTFFYKKTSLKTRNGLLWFDQPLIMGVINLTPDSFYQQSRKNEPSQILDTAGKMLDQGADILDIGAMSTRPGAEIISEAEELKRLLEPLKTLRKTYRHAIISIDTFRSQVARAAIEAGADMINDVSGGELDKSMFKAISELQVPYILMHMRGTPQNMALQNQYSKLMDELVVYFMNKITELHKLGVNDIIIDPGVGFSKNIDQNFELIARLNDFKTLGKPILAGISRKSFIYKTLGTDAENALNGTTALHMLCLINGANLLRVHDVKEAAEVRSLFLKMKTAKVS